MNSTSIDQMSYREARDFVYDFYCYDRPAAIEHAVARMIAEDVLAGNGTTDELTTAKLCEWNVETIGAQAARAFRFAVQFYVKYPGGKQA